MIIKKENRIKVNKAFILMLFLHMLHNYELIQDASAES